MRFKELTKKEQYLSIALIVLNVFALAFMLVAGIKYSVKYIDNDMAKLFVHAVEMSKNGSFL